MTRPNYYNLPLNPHNLFNNQQGKANLGDSICQHLMLIICTPLGKLPSSPNFGCKIWDLQFELIASAHQWENAVASSLEEVIAEFEPRLKEASVKVILSEVEIDYSFRKFPDVKKKAKIFVNGKMSESGEAFGFQTEVFVSPISQ